MFTVLLELDKFRETKLHYSCPLCKAKPGESCVSVSGWKKGRKTSTLHNERLRAAGFGSETDVTYKRPPHEA